MNLILNLIFCHLIGDYVLQIDFIAKQKVIIGTTY